MSQTLSLQDFDYTLPPERIAHHPVSPRDHSRLMVLEQAQALAHHAFYELDALLQAGDVLVVNQTQVIPARLHVHKPTGGRVELLLHTPMDSSVTDATVWDALGKPGAACRPGAVFSTQKGHTLRVLHKDHATVRVEGSVPLWQIMQEEGMLPLPPYIERQDAPEAQDATDYQSIFGQNPGAVAAPTASLHFTPELLEKLKQKGIQMVQLTLHVGPGTFLPIRQEHQQDIRQHTMHAEFYDIPVSTQRAIDTARAENRRVIPVGTTALRALETWGQTQKPHGFSQLFVYPGYKFKKIDGLITNFHLPKSTLLLLVCALAGRDRIFEAYQTAIAQHYRFFSYGDAMLILRVMTTR